MSQQETEKHDSTIHSIQEEDPGNEKISERLEDLQLQDPDDVFEAGKTLDSFCFTTTMTIGNAVLIIYNNLIISIAQKTCKMIYCALHQCLHTTKFIKKITNN